MAIEFKNIKNIINGKYSLCLSEDIIYDIALRVGYDPLDDKCVDYYGDHEEYLQSAVGVNLTANDYINFNDQDFNILQSRSSDNFDKDIFFDHYEVKQIEINEFDGLIIHLDKNI